MTGTRERLAGVGIAVASIGLLCSGTASAASAPAGTPYAGFTSAVTATPVRVEVYEPAIPIPASPQMELNFSYTTVTGSSGPDSTALASALWPGGTIGQGLPTLIGTLGLPAALAGGGYPVQVSAQYPGPPNSGTQEFFPGMTGRVAGTSKGASSRAGYSTSGTVAGDPSGPSGTSALGALQSGNLSALGNLITGGAGSTSNTGSNPLGLLSALVSVGGWSASSVTDYSDPVTVTATGTSQIGEVDLLGGIVKLEGVTVSSVASSSLDGGGKATQKVTYGGLTINGTAFKLTDKGIEAAGHSSAIPGLSSDPTKALASLGISITLPQPTATSKGAEVDTTAQGPTITIDTAPLISQLKLNTLPLGFLTDQLPSSAAQLKGLLLAALQAHPKVVLMLGRVTAEAHTVAALVPPTVGTHTPPPSSGSVGTSSFGAGIAPAAGAPAPGTTPPLAPATTAVRSTSAAPGLPALGGLPGLLLLLGLAVAGGAAWLFKWLAAGALGASGSCPHGLRRGVPDLRKA